MLVVRCPHCRKRVSPSRRKLATGFVCPICEKRVEPNSALPIDGQSASQQKPEVDSADHIDAVLRPASAKPEPELLDNNESNSAEARLPDEPNRPAIHLPPSWDIPILDEAAKATSGATGSLIHSIVRVITAFLLVVAFAWTLLLGPGTLEAIVTQDIVPMGMIQAWTLPTITLTLLAIALIQAGKED